MSRSTKRITVGYDGSPQAGTAVDWAAAEAARRRAQLLVTCVTDHSRAVGVDSGAAAWLPAAALHASRMIAQDGAERAVKAFPQLRVEVATPVGHPAAALIEAGRDSAMLVLGPSGHSSLIGTLLGSVAFAVTAHAHCPVVVARGEANRRPGPGTPVVVGVDDSGSCSAALRFAAETAAGSGAPLTVVCAWLPTLPGGWASAYWAVAAPTLDSDAAAREAAEQVANAAAAHVRLQYPQVQVSPSAVSGEPVPSIVSLTRPAALVVVGARGRGGFTGLLLGSVSRGLALHSPCPVAVVRGHRA
jgi:nucleotide-binding universal stress UspA family protein